MRLKPANTLIFPGSNAFPQSPIFEAITLTQIYVSQSSYMGTLFYLYCAKRILCIQNFLWTRVALSQTVYIYRIELYAWCTQRTKYTKVVKRVSSDSFGLSRRAKHTDLVVFFVSAELTAWIYIWKCLPLFNFNFVFIFDLQSVEYMRSLCFCLCGVFDSKAGGVALVGLYGYLPVFNAIKQFNY